MKTKIAIVDDHKLFLREGIKRILKFCGIEILIICRSWDGTEV